MEDGRFTLEDLREWIDKIIKGTTGLEFHSFYVHKTLGRPTMSYKKICSVPAPGGKFTMPDDAGYVFGYCMAAADLDLLDLHEFDKKVYYRLKIRGKNDHGTFEHSKHFMRTSNEGGCLV